MPETAPNPNFNLNPLPVPISMPIKRELFELTDPNESKRELEILRSNTIELKKAMTVLAEVEKGKGKISKSQAGAEAGKCLVKYLSSYSNNNIVLKQVREYIEGLYNSPKKAGEFMSGFVGEYAFAHLLTKHEGHKVKYPETTEDMKLKADWVIEQPNQPDKFMQTKVVPLADFQVNDAQLIFDIGIAGGMDNLRNNLAGYQFTKEVNIDEHMGYAQAMIQANQGSGRQLLYCLIPSCIVSTASGIIIEEDFKQKFSSELNNVGI